MSRFAGSREERTASVLLGQLTLERGQPADALARFEGYLGTDPDGALAEEARLGRALALEQLGQRDDARRAWQDLLQKHPRSLHARRARARLESLQAHPPDRQDPRPLSRPMNARRALSALLVGLAWMAAAGSASAQPPPGHEARAPRLITLAIAAYTDEDVAQIVSYLRPLLEMRGLQMAVRRVDALDSAPADRARAPSPACARASGWI